MLANIVTKFIEFWYMLNKDYENQRPKLDILEIAIFPTKVQTYVGKHVKWGDKDENGKRVLIEGSPYAEIVLDKKYVRRESKLTLKNDDGRPIHYFFVNLCCKESVKEHVVLMFNALNITFRLADTEVDMLCIKEAYLMKRDTKSLGKDMPCNVPFRVEGASELKMPIVYACVSGEEVSLNLENIYRRKEREVEKITLYKLGNADNIDIEYEAKEYIFFDEAGYLIECVPKGRRKPYRYSVFLKLEDRQLIVDYIADGSKEFYRKKKEAYRKEKEKNEA